MRESFKTSRRAIEEEGHSTVIWTENIKKSKLFVSLNFLTN